MGLLSSTKRFSLIPDSDCAQMAYTAKDLDRADNARDLLTMMGPMGWAGRGR
jgi:hypothetical protein